MVETHRPELEGQSLRYNGDRWELTGDLELKGNGELIVASAHERDRVRGNAGSLKFTLQNPPASLNPGNPGEFTADLVVDGAHRLEITRGHTTDRYALTSLQYR